DCFKESKNSKMSSHGYNPLSSVCKATLPEVSINETTLSDELENNTIVHLLSEITTYFVDQGFQSSLRLDPMIFIGIERSSVRGIASGKDKRLLVKWGLTEEVASELRDSVCDNTIWSKQLLYHWLFEWILNSWDSFSQKDGPQLFSTSYEDIAIGIDDFLSSNMKVADANTMHSTYHAFFHTTNQQSAQAISKNGIKLQYCKPDLNFGAVSSFYLNPSIDNAIDLIKHYISEGEDLWKSMVVASRCGQYSAVDDDDFRNSVPNAQWFELIRHLQLAIKSRRPEIKSKEITTDYLEQLQILLLTKNEM
ncbi:5819_t:CDS:2, partial [Gigaspora rosea]